MPRFPRRGYLGVDLIHRKPIQPGLGRALPRPPEPIRRKVVLHRLPGVLFGGHASCACLGGKGRYLCVRKVYRKRHG